MEMMAQQGWTTESLLESINRLQALYYSLLEEKESLQVENTYLRGQLSDTGPARDEALIKKVKSFIEDSRVLLEDVEQSVLEFKPV
jgi:regulator of replication initiation timing